MENTKSNSVGSEDIMDSDKLKIVMLESIGDEAIIRKLQGIFTPSFDCLTEAVDQLVRTNQLLRQQLQEKDAAIAQLQQRCETLENKVDDMEQWTRRGSMRIQGLPETSEGQVEEKILSLCNEELGLVPPLQLAEIEVAHRLHRPRGQADAMQRRQSVPQSPQSASPDADRAPPSPGEREGLPASGQPDSPEAPPCMVIVKFISRRTKSRVMSSRKDLKNIDRETYPRSVYFHDDLTTKRAKLAYQARQLKRSSAILDRWVFDSKVMVKDNRSRVHDKRTQQDIDKLD